MKLLFNTTTKEFPISRHYLGVMDPTYNVYQPLPTGIVEYVEEEKPEYNRDTQICTKTEPIEIENSWVMKWKVYNIGECFFDEATEIWYPIHPLVMAQND